jgi:hypothetical protein
MFQVDSDLTIYLTRGDMIAFAVKAKADGEPYVFQPGDVVRFNVCEKKNVENVIFIKDFPVTEECEEVEIMLTCEETKFGAKISKPVDYWYWVVLNPLQPTAQSIIGYDEDGAKILKLFPEGDDVDETDPIEPEDIPIVDNELDLTSPRPVQNQAVARAITRISYLAETTQKALAVEKARLDNILEDNFATLAQSLEYMSYISEETKAKIDADIASDGVFATIVVNLHEANQFYGGSGMDVFIIPDECRPIDVGTVHTESGVEFRVGYDSVNSRYVLYIGAKNDVLTAPEEAITVRFSYALGDHELKDIRLGADGVTYPTAGEAVRAQFAALNAAIAQLLEAINGEGVSE